MFMESVVNLELGEAQEEEKVQKPVEEEAKGSWEHIQDSFKQFVGLVSKNGCTLNSPKQIR